MTDHEDFVPMTEEEALAFMARQPKGQPFTLTNPDSRRYLEADMVLKGASAEQIKAALDAGPF